jgi:thiol:disulfide interchange protein
MKIPASAQSTVRAVLQQSLKGNEPVFVEMTAAWCITCKVNHKIAIDIPSTRKLFEDMQVRYLIGDWTNEDPDITKFLQSYGRSGVPIYVYYGPRDPATGKRPDAKVLPQVLTPALVESFIKGQ